ncbi:AAA family ATPase [Parablautia muri]|uniref:AAA+ ATPase domain-containing protein n=1 Tax=Parablautia muri TaxID=2320879 RepID=A0A9X5BFT6_9FIRM|nr:AAA family ATPase [Parablautia muri]NBJ92909.1 hypothetical protein [Parablautia muri]
MEQVYLTEINIRQVRHLQNIKIELPQNEKKHLLITGINGCGKTSVLKAIENSFLHVMGFMGQDWKEIKFDSSSDKIDIRSNLSNSIDGKEMYKLYQEGQIILIYFSADRKFTMNKSKTVGAFNIYKVKMFTEKMNTSFGQLLVYLYVEKLFAREKGDEETVKDVEKWFEWLQGALRELFDNAQLELKFLLEDMCFKIKLPGREEFGLDEMASGYEALFDLFSEIVIRMEQQAHLKYDLPGIVLIDEIELHLHIAWQKKVLPFLVRVFPNLQFIVATHSPFVVSSIESAVIYDLEKNIMVGNLSAYSYECLVESLFSTTVFSDVMGNKYGRYRELVEKDTSRSVSEDEELVDLIKYFQSIPFFVAEDIILDFQITESQRKHGKDK